MDATTFRLLRRVVGKWLVGHSPAAKWLLGHSALGIDVVVGAQHSADAAAAAGIRVSIETPSGAVVGHPPQFAPTQRVRDVQAWIFANDAEQKFQSSGSVLLFAAGQAAALDGAVELGTLAEVDRNQSGGSDGWKALTLIVLVHQVRWSRINSNQILVFSDNDRGITRPGNRSSYPCGRSEKPLRGPGDSFTVLIKKLVVVANGLTIGIESASGGPLVKQGSGGVGHNRNSMGISIRNIQAVAGKEPRECIRVAGTLCGPKMYLFQSGDRLKFALREQKGVHDGEQDVLALDFYLNGEVFFTAPIPTWFMLPFIPLCTLPDDCTLILEQQYSSPTRSRVQRRGWRTATR